MTAGGYLWTDIYQAYHSLLRYHEEANSAADWAVLGEKGAQYYETEQQEYQEMIEDAAVFTRRAMDDGLGRLVGAITTETDRDAGGLQPAQSGTNRRGASRRRSPGAEHHLARRRDGKTCAMPTHDGRKHGVSGR